MHLYTTAPADFYIEPLCYVGYYSLGPGIPEITLRSTKNRKGI